MTVNTTTSVITYPGNNSTTIWTFPFIGVQASDLQVTIINSQGSSVINPSLYSVTINPVPVGGLWGIGGSVTYPLSGSPIPIGTFISIQRIIPYTQSISINNQGAFYPQAVEQMGDILELQIQQIEDNQLYAIQAPLSDLTPPSELPPASLRASKYLFFDNNGNPTVTSTAPPAPVTIANANPRVVSVSGTNTITMLTTDSLGGISVYQSSSPITTVQLPATLGPYPIFDGSDNAASFPLTVLPPAGKTILGQTSYVINTCGGSATFWLDGTEILVA